MAGRFLVSEASTQLLVFSMERRLPPNSELVQAVLRLFREPVPKAALRRHERLSPRSDLARVTVEWLHVRADGSNRTALIDSRWGVPGGAGRGGQEGARGSVSGRGMGGRGRGRGLPGPRPSAPGPPWRRRLVSVHESGWKAFDVTEAVTFWQQLSRPREPLLLQVSVQREHLGPLASSAHRLVRFAPRGPPDGAQGEPQLELHTLDLGHFG